jgi:hypothetical protein
MIDLASPVPYTVDRRTTPQLLLLTNRSRERLHGISFSLLGSGVMRTSAPLMLDPGQQLRLSVRGEQLSRRAIVVVRWFWPDGTEYLWRIAF